MADRAEARTTVRVDAFALRDEGFDRHCPFIEGRIKITDDPVRGAVKETLPSERLWPDWRLRINPKVPTGASTADLVVDGRRAGGCVRRLVRETIDEVHDTFRLPGHHGDGIRPAAAGLSCVMTSHMESGKSLTCTNLTVNTVLRDRSGRSDQPEGGVSGRGAGGQADAGARIACAAR